MKTLNNYPSIKKELASHVIDRITDRVIDNTNKDDWHYYCFNEDYYIIGYFEANEWLKRHNIDAFEAIGICQEYEKEIFGEQTKVYDNSETTVNMLAYILGEELLNDEDFETVEELQQAMEEIINS
jgi:hypothetical protein